MTWKERVLSFLEDLVERLGSVPSGEADLMLPTDHQLLEYKARRGEAEDRPWAA